MYITNSYFAYFLGWHLGCWDVCKHSFVFMIGFCLSHLSPHHLSGAAGHAGVYPAPTESVPVQRTPERPAQKNHG